MNATEKRRYLSSLAAAESWFWWQRFTRAREALKSYVRTGTINLPPLSPPPAIGVENGRDELETFAKVTNPYSAQESTALVELLWAWYVLVQRPDLVNAVPPAPSELIKHPGAFKLAIDQEFGPGVYDQIRDWVSKLTPVPQALAAAQMRAASLRS